MKNRKLWSLILASSLVLSTCFAGNYLENPDSPTGGGDGSSSSSTSFLDVQGHWAEDVIGVMVGKGLFSGKSEEIFAPDAAMSRAEFITVVVRYLYPTASYVDPSPWYAGYYQTAESEGLLPITFREKYMTENISRQEMAYIMAATLEKIGETTTTLLTGKTIPDYKEIGSAYQPSVLFTYSLGIISGVDSQGSFAPYSDATRAACAVVLLNMVDSSYRQEVDFGQDPDALTDMNRMDITFTKSRDFLTYDYTDTLRPIAKVGDTILIKGVEKKVIAHPTQATVNGMAVPYISSGVPLDLGIDTQSVYGVVEHGFSGGNNHYGGDTYYVNPNTKDGYWSSQWEAILSKVPAPGTKGTKDGQVSTDAYKLYVWSEEEATWLPAYLQ